ncbi:MAG: hypothetical protein JO010_08945, partial [Alphaproteobacteria bacterium]|nr:hypothetical protein [Alphaproteobacteria bacterium]
QIRNKLSLSFRSLGDKSYKNIPQRVRTFSITEDGGAPPTIEAPNRARGRLAAWLALLLLILAIGSGYWALSGTRHDEVPPAPIVAEAGAAKSASAVPAGSSGGDADGLYSGPICYGPGPNDQARCFRAQAALRGEQLSGRWPGREPGVTMILAGNVSASGEVQIELHSETADGARLVTIDLKGLLRDGRLDATGRFRNGRTAQLNWHRRGPAPD